ncbi:MAG: hypothetical protein ACHQQR_15430, partial [Gemmatimonadales bacterium]
MPGLRDAAPTGCGAVLLVALAASCARPVQVPAVAPVPAPPPAIQRTAPGASAKANGVPGATPPDSSRLIPPATPASVAGVPPRRVASDSVPPDVTPAEIAREVIRVFGDSAPPPMVVTAAAPDAPVWDIDVHSYETHARVEHFVEVFTGRAKPEFEKSLQRQTRYGALIRQKLHEGGLPEDMTYLALIESWYDPLAYSKAA